MNRMHIARKLAGQAKPVMTFLIITSICSVIQHLLGIALFVVGAHGVASVAHAQLTQSAENVNVWPYVGLLIGLSLGKALFRYIEQYSGHFVAFTALEQLRLFLFSRIWPQAPAISASSRTGDLLSRVTRDIDRIEVFFAHTIAPAVSAFVVPIIVVVFIGVTTTPALTVAALLFLLVAAFLVPFLGGNSARDNAAKGLVERGANLHYVTETIQGVREIVGFDYSQRRLDGIDERSASIAALGEPTWWMIGVRRGLAHALQLLSLLPFILVGGQYVASGSFTIVELLTALAAVLCAFPAVRGLEDVVSDLDRALASAARLFKLADATPQVSDPQAPQPLVQNGTGNGPRIEFKDISFTYPPQEGRVATGPAAEHISLIIEPGKHLALVGASGAGKSTLVQLLLRFWDVDSGAITINGSNVKDLELATLRGAVSVVTQATHMFNMTIADNLRLASPEATDTEILMACQIACLDDDIAAFPKGLDTNVGELGDNLSGGQRQRLSLARALLSKASILVLDEFTSHLDEATAARVRANLTQARPNATIIEITHRLSDALDADEIAVVSQGRIIEIGTPVDLTTRDSEFSTLLKASQRD